MRYPPIVAFSLDGTIWSDWLNPSRFGSVSDLWMAWDEIVSLRDPSQHVTVSFAIPWIINDLLSHGVKIAICSQNWDKQLCARAMWLIRIRVPDGCIVPLPQLISYIEIEDVPIENHFVALRTWSGLDYDQMLFFDDQAINNEAEMCKGVTFYKVDGRRGMTESDYWRELDVWYRNQRIRCPMPLPGLDHAQRKQIGWVGMDETTAFRFERGQRHPMIGYPRRWGWGLYVCDDPAIAAELVIRGRSPHDTDDLYICPVFVRDFKVFRNMNKVWVPEYGSIPQTGIARSSVGQMKRDIAEAQIKRDDMIEEEFGVRKPYILFARHYWIRLLDNIWRRNHWERFSEMVIPPQVQDALFYGGLIRYSHAQYLIERHKLEDFDFRSRLREWNIKSNRETEEDFSRHHEYFW